MNRNQTGTSGRVRGKAPARRLIQDTERLLLRSHLLPADDRSLLQMILDRGGTFEQVARLAGKSPSAVRRRFNRILRQLLAWELTTLLARRKTNAPIEISIARAHFIQGLSQQAICDKLGVSPYRIQTTLRDIRKIIYCQAFEKF